MMVLTNMNNKYREKILSKGHKMKEIVESMNFWIYNIFGKERRCEKCRNQCM